MLSHHILAVLGLATSTASAIDMRLFWEGNCQGNKYITCTGWNPDTCCGTDNVDYTYSAGVFAIPTEWSVIGTIYAASNCGNQKSNPIINNGQTGMCWAGQRASGRNGYSNNYVRAVSYRFAGKKRGVETRQAKEGQCQRANTLHMEDGTEYDLSALDNSTYDAVLSMSGDASKYAEIAKVQGVVLL